jgi:phage terminase large subunit GpA-like protein
LRGGRIHSLYESSDQRRYLLPCPGCGREDWVTWNDPKHFRVAFDDRRPETARLVCPTCEEEIDETTRGAQIARGRWQPTAMPRECGLVGFHVSAMLSPWVSLPDLVARFLSAHARGREAFRVFVNTALGEPWEDRTQRMEPHWLAARREHYGNGIEVPDEAYVLTAGIDVQQERVELLVTAWGREGERWLIDYGQIPGALKHADTQATLLEALQGRYRHVSGARLPIHATCIDSGYSTDEVYSFVLAHQHRRIFATKGFAGRSGDPIVGKPSEKQSGRGRPVRLYPVNVDDGKAEIIACLAVTPPGPGAMHFPTQVESINEEFFAQLCAEHRETRFNRFGVATHQVWVQDRARNEALDLSVLCLAAFKLLNPRLDQFVDACARLAVEASAGEQTQPPPTVDDRLRRAPWLQRRR